MWTSPASIVFFDNSSSEKAEPLSVIRIYGCTPASTLCSHSILRFAWNRRPIDRATRAGRSTRSAQDTRFVGFARHGTTSHAAVKHAANVMENPNRVAWMCAGSNCVSESADNSRRNERGSSRLTSFELRAAPLIRAIGAVDGYWVAGERGALYVGLLPNSALPTE